MTTAPTPNWTAESGAVVQLRHGAYAATVVAVGASLAALRFAGRDLVVPFDVAAVRPVSRGVMLAPWPNRVIDGRYRFDGVDYLLPLTEPARGHALHGFVCWQEWTVAATTASSVRLTTEIVPSDAYPWRIALEVVHALGAHGLSSTITATNLSASDAPYGASGHPYLTAGGAPIDVCRVQLSADRVGTTIGDRLLPGPWVPVADSPFAGLLDDSVLGATAIDHAFAGLQRDDAGVASVSVTAPDGFGVRLQWGAELPWVQLYTSDHPDPALHRTGVAVEPMTCPPNAFATGEGLIRLAPGAAAGAGWTIAAIG